MLKESMFMKELMDTADKEILDIASNITNGDRKKDYGDPYYNHSNIAKMWSVFLGVEIKPRDVCVMMILLKACREINAPKDDTLVDMAGYSKVAKYISLKEGLLDGEPVVLGKNVLEKIYGKQEDLEDITGKG